MYTPCVLGWPFLIPIKLITYKKKKLKKKKKKKNLDLSLNPDFRKNCCDESWIYHIKKDYDFRKNKKNNDLYFVTLVGFSIYLNSHLYIFIYAYVCIYIHSIMYAV